MTLVARLLLGSAGLGGSFALSWIYISLMGNLYLRTRKTAALRALSLVLCLLLLPVTVVLAIPILVIYWSFGYAGDIVQEWHGAEDFRRLLEAMADLMDNPLAPATVES